MADITVESICTCGGFNSFRDYCQEHNLVYLSEMTDEHLAQYKQRKGVGAMKYQIVARQIELFKQKAGS